MADRCAKLSRKTKETDISVGLNIDGTGKSNIDTGIGFFNHMLEGFSKHGFFDLDMTCDGDLNVDCHHTIEDCGIVLGNAIAQAVGDKKGIKRFGSFILPMDEVLVLCAIDLSGRPYLQFDGEFTCERVGDMDTEMVREFFYAVSYSAAMNLHINYTLFNNSLQITYELCDTLIVHLHADLVYHNPRRQRTDLLKHGKSVLLKCSSGLYYITNHL
jgi:imidazoleglycerol-phosphate dehydratase